MKIEADHYRLAALERIRAAEVLFNGRLYAECIYVAGVATECMLRAYRARFDPAFDSRHDLADLLNASGLEDLIPEKRRREVAAALGDVWVRWKNDYRYASSELLSAALRRRGLFDKIKGNQLKANARTTLDKSLELVGIGAARWAKTSSTS